MFKHILLPVDGSAASAEAVQKGLALARAFSSTVTVIYVIDPYAFTGMGTDFSYGQTEYLNAANAEARETLAAAQALFTAQGVTAQTSVIEAQSIYRGILDTADSTGADLIVMGSHGRRGLEKLVLGSVTAQVLSHAQLPVLVVRSGAE